MSDTGVREGPSAFLDPIVDALMQRTSASKVLHGSPERVLPQPDVAREIIELSRQILFFGYVGRQDLSGERLRAHLNAVTAQWLDLVTDQIARSFRHDCRQEHRPCDQCVGRAVEQARLLAAKLPHLRDQLEEDIQAAYDGDPAAQSFDEIIFCYPGLYAITVHRLAHELYDQGVPLLPRLLSEIAHTLTGIDIHPGAHIGRAFFIDHGTGVVIGETTVIGDNVKIYQGATLGALSFPKDACGALIRGTKRHPTIEDHVTIYAGATILGGDTVIGKGSAVGGSVWLTHSIAPGTKVVIESPRLQFKNAHAKDKTPSDMPKGT